MRSPTAAVIAIATSLLVLISYFVPAGPVLAMRSLLLDWAVILAAVAGVIAILNMVGVHFRRVHDNQPLAPYSLIVVVTFVITLLAGLFFSPSDPQFRQVVTAIQVPVEASLLAVVSISLAYAALRFFQNRKGLMAVTFAISAVVFLLLASGILAGLAQVPVLGTLLAVLNRLPMAGARGILLGVAIGSLIAGLRIAIGAHRPYSG